MKVFISWSGELSHQVACILREWLPYVIQAVKPYVSSKDIDKGDRWSTDIAAELFNSAYGIICLTKINVNAPWINFEAGALSKTIEKSNVSPFLFRMKHSDIPAKSPLNQFQATLYEKHDVFSLIKSINAKLDAEVKLEESQLVKSFERWWPELEETLSKIELQGEEVPAESVSTSSIPEMILEELLELVRTQHRILQSPEELLPPDYISRVMQLKEFEFSALPDDYVHIVLQLTKVGDSILKKLEMPDSKYVARLYMVFQMLNDSLTKGKDPTFRQFLKSQSQRLLDQN